MSERKSGQYVESEKRQKLTEPRSCKGLVRRPETVKKFLVEIMVTSAWKTTLRQAETCLPEVVRNLKG